VPKKGKKNQTSTAGYFLQPATEKSAIKQAKAIARLAIQPERRQIKAEQRASKLQSKYIKSYFPEYQQTLDQSAADTAAAYQQAQGQIGQTSAAAANYAEQLRQRLQQEGATDAASRGATYNPAGDYRDTSAQLARINSANVLGAVTAAQGASQQGYYRQKKATGKREMYDQLLKEEARRRSYNADLRALASKAGDLRSTEFERLREADRDFALAQQTASGTAGYNKAITKQAKLGLAGKQASAAATVQASQNALKGDQTTAQAFGGQQKGGGQGGNAPTQADLRRAAALLRQRVNPDWPKQRMIDTLVNSGVSVAAARKVVNRALKQRAKPGELAGQAIADALMNRR
jgi:hypothetical protein